MAQVGNLGKDRNKKNKSGVIQLKYL